MKFQESKDLTSIDFSHLFGALESANEVAQNFTNDEEALVYDKLIVNKIRLNSPLEIELIVTGFGAVYLLVQIFDKINSWGKVSLEKEKLKLENEKLKLENEKLENDFKKINLLDNDNKFNNALSQLEELKFKLDEIEVNALDA
jgi:cell division protein FtsB